MHCRFNLSIVLAVTAGVVLLGTSPLVAGAWRQLEPIPTQYPYGVYDFVVDSSGTPWAAVGNLVWWWDGQKWNQATDGRTPYSSGQCTGRLYGDSQRGAYLSQKAQHECEGTLFRLEAGKSHPVGTFRVDRYHVSPGIYISRAGNVFNFGERFLAVLNNGRWQSVEVEMGSSREQVRMVDLGPEGPVVFVPQRATKAGIYDGETFHTDVPLPEFNVDSPGNVRMTRWGKDRVLFWRFKSRLLGAAEMAGNRFEPVDTAALEDQLGNPERIYGVTTAPDGSLWARVGRRKLSEPNLVRIAPDGKVTRHKAQSIMWGTDPAHCYQESALHARGGTFWFGILKGGIGSVRDEKVHAHDWRDGVLAADVRYIAEAPDGTVYAAAGNPRHHVHRWDPEAAPDRRLTESWEAIDYRISRKVIADFDGHPWLFRLDRPGKVSLWDGTEWRDVDAPVDPDGLRYAVADDHGHLTVVELLAPRRSYVLGPDGVQQYENLREALVARVRAGARRFRTPDRDLVPPVVTRDGRIWLALSPYYKKRDLFAYFDGKWQPMELKGVNAMGVDETGRMVFISWDAVWTWRDGRFEKLADVDTSKRSRFKVLGQYDRHGNVPFVDDPPEFLRRHFTLYAGRGGQDYYPMPWRALREGAGEFPEPKSLDTGRPVRITYPGRAVPAPGGGAWLLEPHRAPLRSLDELIFRVNPLETPLAHQWWVDAGVTAPGGVWVVAGDSHGGQRIFFRRPRPKEQMPTVGIRKSEVKYGRHLLWTWDLPAKRVAGAVWRADPDDYWHVLDGATFQRSFTEPGKHVLRLEAMALDDLGVPGPVTVQTVEVEVGLPRTRWTEEPPECLDDLAWIVPVDADWTHPDVPRRIEWRVAGADWLPLPEDRRLPVARYNNQAVEFQFRAVEEGRFADPKPLVLKVAVEMSLEEVIAKRINLILSGAEAERHQAVEDLKAAPKEAALLLRKKLEELRIAEQRCRAALTEVEAAKP